MAQPLNSAIFEVRFKSGYHVHFTCRSCFADLFTKIDKLQTDPTYNPHGIARFRCLEDYATYYRHMPGTDGRENMSAPLVAEVYNIRSTLLTFSESTENLFQRILC